MSDIFAICFFHYENLLIQIYTKFYLLKLKILSLKVFTFLLKKWIVDAH